MVFCALHKKQWIIIIKKTSTDLDLDISVIKSDVFKFLEKSKASYDIIFADPPYELELEKFLKLVELVFQNELLETDGVLIIEHSKQTNLSSASQFTEVKGYGGNRFSFFEN